MENSSEAVLKVFTTNNGDVVLFKKDVDQCFEISQLKNKSTIQKIF